MYKVSAAASHRDRNRKTKLYRGQNPKNLTITWARPRPKQKRFSQEEESETFLLRSPGEVGKEYSKVDLSYSCSKEIKKMSIEEPLKMWENNAATCFSE